MDLRTDAPPSLRGDVAIVGAGAAGIIFARYLCARGLDVLLLESGGQDYEATASDLNRGENVGLDYYPLDHARLRFFGGTTAIWGGRCAELDPIDFAVRPWVPHSGWPFTHADIQPYYRAAREIFGLAAKDPGPDDLRQAGVPLPGFASDELATPIWTFDDRSDRFAIKSSDDLIRHPRCTIVLHATVCDIRTDESARSVTKLIVSRPDGRRVEVAAADYVLAAGGIENPRLLLASRSVMPMGLGNHHDQVGRYFMEHPHARGGRIVESDARRLFAAFAKRRLSSATVAPLIAAAPALQAREGLLNTSLTVAPRRPATGSEAWAMRAYLHAKDKRDPDRIGRTLWRTTKKGVAWLQQRVDPLRPALLHRLGRLDVALVVRGEQAPNPDSRVTLSAEQDALGMPRVRLDWRTSPLDVHSVAHLVAALGRETQRLGLGRTEPAPWLSDPSRQWVTDKLISAHPIGGYHHMGTTRMSNDATKGVTDKHGCVHGIDNLYIAGSSLFPTSGWANPTLTIAALALRTSDRLAAKAQLRSAHHQAHTASA